MRDTGVTGSRGDGDGVGVAGGGGIVGTYGGGGGGRGASLLGGAGQKLFTGGGGRDTAAACEPAISSEDEDEDGGGGGGGGEGNDGSIRGGGGATSDVTRSFLGRSLRRLSHTSSRSDIRPQLQLAIILQVLQQAVGINVVMYYSASIFHAAGVTGAAAAVHLALAVAAISALGSAVGVVAMDAVGRRPLMLSSLAGCAVALVVLAGCFADVDFGPSSPVSEVARGACAAATTCGDCLAASSCGFCASGGVGQPGRCMMGSAVGPDSALDRLAAAAVAAGGKAGTAAGGKASEARWSFIHHYHARSSLTESSPQLPKLMSTQPGVTTQTPQLTSGALVQPGNLTAVAAAVEARSTSATTNSTISTPHLSPLPTDSALPSPPPRTRHRSHQSIVTCDGNWQYHACPSRLGLVTLGAQMLYVASFQAGVSPVPWVVAAEVFPVSVRGAAGGIAATAHWSANLVMSTLFPVVFKQLGGSAAFGTLFFFAVVAWLYTWIVLPETRGLSPAEVGAVMRDSGGGRASWAVPRGRVDGGGRRCEAVGVR
jgi:hypothetical protein